MEREYYHDWQIRANIKINGSRIRVGKLVKKKENLVLWDLRHEKRRHLRRSGTYITDSYRRFEGP